MASGTFNCAGCGDIVYFNVGKNRRDTDRHGEWLESQGALCTECKLKERQAENAAAAEANAVAGLPQLTGSINQISWAETIRAKKLETIRQARAGELQQIYIDAFWGSVRNIFYEDRVMPVDNPFVDYAVSLINNQTSATWWIDNREMKVGFILKDLFVKYPPVEESTEVEHEIMNEVLAEATIRPESPRTETIAEIQIHENKVEIHFTEKREDFWQIIKKQLGYRWSGTAWVRTMGIKTGAAPDRAAEAGNCLLAAGFIIRIFDSSIRDAAISGMFKPECKRWVMKKTAGAYVGWFSINWQDRNERLYNAARKLKGSKYVDKVVVVPAEQYEAVLDFARMFEFGLSPGALEVIELSRQRRESSLIAKPAKPEARRLPQPGNKPPRLTVPEQVDVAAEFQDNADSGLCGRQ